VDLPGGWRIGKRIKETLSDDVEKGPGASPRVERICGRNRTVGKGGSEAGDKFRPAKRPPYKREIQRFGAQPVFYEKVDQGGGPRSMGHQREDRDERGGVRYATSLTVGELEGKE